MKAEKITNLGERIQQCRIRMKMTQEDLAKRIGVSRPSVTQWESGDTKNIKNDNLLALARAFKISVDELLTGKVSGYSLKGSETDLHQVAESSADAYSEKKLEQAIEFVEDILDALAKSVSSKQKSKLVREVMAMMKSDGSFDARAASQIIAKTKDEE